MIALRIHLVEQTTDNHCSKADARLLRLVAKWRILPSALNRGAQDLHNHALVGFTPYDTDTDRRRKLSVDKIARRWTEKSLYEISIH